jgi:adenylate cyclase
MTTVDPGESLSAFSGELKHLSRVVSELEGAFRKQRELLKQKGMSLPPGTLQGIQSIYTELEALSRQFEEEQGELLQLRALRQTAELINSTLNLDEVLNYVMNEAIGLTHAERGYLVLRDKNTGQLTFRVARNITGSLSEDEFTVSRSIVEEVGRTGNPVVTTNAQQDAIWKDKESIIGLKLLSILCVPLMLRGEVTGVIYADNRLKKGIFAERELQLLEAFANQAAVAIENARLFESARASLAEATAVKELMDNVFASIGSGVITTDAKDTVTTFNDAAERILEVPRALVLDQPLWSALPPLTDSFESALRRVLQLPAPEPEVIEAQPILVGHSEPSILSLKLSPLYNAARVTQGAAIVVDDLTESRRREEQLKAIRRYLTPAMVDNIQSIDQLGLGGERRQVTAMFVDVRDFAAFPVALQPREFMQLLNRYLTVAVNAVSRHEGIVDKYMANEVMALFNTQLNPATDHGLRAILAALTMADTYLNELYPRLGEPPGACYYRVGIHTGEATLGNTGSEARKEFTAIGDTINLAHRLLEHAQPGQIVISRECYQHCATHLDGLPGLQLVDRGQIQVKGLKRPVSIYEITRVPQIQA